MRTGNGRHRRPRQAPALVVAAGVTGSAIALPLLASTGAHAADATTWDRVALCESGGIWSADLGNGHYGGLQFSQATWDKYGGGEYAARPDLASRSQQIAVAQKAYVAEGATPWASCAAIAGLTKGDAATASVDPGSPDTASPGSAKPTGSAKDPADADTDADADGGKGVPSEGAPSGQAPSGRTSPGPSGSPSGSPAGSSTPSAHSSPTSDPSSDTSDSSGDSGTSGSRSSDTPGPSDSASSRPSDPAASADSPSGSPSSPGSDGPGRHRGGKAADGTGTSRDETGRHASRGGAASRNDARTDGSYTVRAGDNLWAIAEAHDLPGGWPALYAANHRTVGGDPDFIVPGQSLDLDQKQG
ncbi:LysM peptidoglycan-binding domain-containing protein [Streptomyces sp. NBC_01471]|uniref:LysM peptidoglycan-binding domain-containing protein n=1 Tax=Streptomyces sp. NBC_01471 TaxID=2903879 RepID=UPI00324E6AE2